MTSSLNSLTNALASLFTTQNFHIAPFAGGDDFIAIAESDDLDAIRAQYHETYGIKGQEPRGLGLFLDSFKTHKNRFDFLSYDCKITHSGIEVVKQVKRVVRYGSACLSHHNPDTIAAEAMNTASSVVPPSYQLFGVSTNPKHH